MTKWKSVLLAGAAITALSQGAARAEEVTIGMAVAQSGWMEAYDGEATKMAELWVEQVNAKGGLLGSPIKVIKADTKTDRVEGAKAGQAMIEGGADLLLVSADYDYGAPAALQGQKADVTTFFLGAADPKAGVVGVGRNAFTTLPAAQVEGATMAEFGFKSLGSRKGYELVDEMIEYNKSICAGYRWKMGELEAEGATLVGSDSFKGTDPTISSQITRLTEAVRTGGVDHIMLCSTNPGAISALRQIRAAGIDLPIFSGTAMDGTYWVESVPGLKDFYLPTLALTADDPRPALNELTAAYAAKYGKPPTTQYAYPIYAVLDMWKEAVEKTGSTAAKGIVAELETAADKPTIMGPMTFTSKYHIQTNKPMLVVSYADGKVSFVEEAQITGTIPDAVLYRLK